VTRWVLLCVLGAFLCAAAVLCVLGAFLCAAAVLCVLGAFLCAAAAAVHSPRVSTPDRGHPANPALRGRSVEKSGADEQGPASVGSPAAAPIVVATVLSTVSLAPGLVRPSVCAAGLRRCGSAFPGRARSRTAHTHTPCGARAFPMWLRLCGVQCRGFVFGACVVGSSAGRACAAWQASYVAAVLLDFKTALLRR
jgi:hypothetical protein